MSMVSALCGLVFPLSEKRECGDLPSMFRSVWSFPAFQGRTRWNPEAAALLRLHDSLGREACTQRHGFYIMFRNKHLRSVETCRPDVLISVVKRWHYHHLPNVEVASK